MNGWEYLGALLVALAGMAVMDHRWRLFFFADGWRATLVLAVGAGFFLAWDFAAIDLSIFVRGHGSALTGIEVAPHLPLEELFFITFLCYLTMVLYGLVRRFAWRPAAREEARV